MKTETATQIRWLIRRDLEDVLAIERMCFPDPWTEAIFMATLRGQNVIGRVAERNGMVVGFVIYGLSKTNLEVINLAVLPDCQRDGIGEAIISRLKAGLAQQRRKTMEVVIRETNLDGQLFFRAMGFQAKRILRGQYLNSDEDSYQMIFQI